MVSRVGIFYCLAVLTGLGLAQTTDNGMVCTEDKDCTDPSNVVCISGTCACPEATHVLAQDECLPFSTEFGSACKLGLQCTKTWGDLATCTDGTCSCASEAVFHQDSCYYKIPLVGEPCTNNNKQLCYLDANADNQHVECYSGTCICESGYTATNDSLKCLQISTEFGSACESSSQCTKKWGDLAQCSGGKCSCQDGSIFDKTLCYAKIPLVGATCDRYNSQRCYLDGDGDNQHVECFLGVCRCMDFYTASADNKTCHETIVGDKCDNYCTLLGDGSFQHVLCDEGKCRCTYGYVPTDDNRSCRDTGALHLISISCLLLVALVKIVT